MITLVYMYDAHGEMVDAIAVGVPVAKLAGLGLDTIIHRYGPTPPGYPPYRAPESVATWKLVETVDDGSDIPF